MIEYDKEKVKKAWSDFEKKGGISSQRKRGEWKGWITQRDIDKLRAQEAIEEKQRKERNKKIIFIIVVGAILVYFIMWIISAHLPNYTVISDSKGRLPPDVTNVETYRKGKLVYFRIYYNDPNNNAEGFGFRGAKGSRWAGETIPFSSPAYGRWSPGKIEYPFNHLCGTGGEFSSEVVAWIYDSDGSKSEQVKINLDCNNPKVESYSPYAYVNYQTPKKCTFNKKGNNGWAKGTVYYGSREGLLRVNTVQKNHKKKSLREDYIIINMTEEHYWNNERYTKMIYFWNNVSSKAIKTHTKLSTANELLEKDIKYNCETWKKVDKSYFEPPRHVRFKYPDKEEYESYMEGINEYKL